MYACLAVTCHLHFWQNDRDFLRATVVTRGWNGYRNKSQHRKSTLEKKILPPFQQGFEPATFQSRVRCSNHWAIPTPLAWPGSSIRIYNRSRLTVDNPLSSCPFGRNFMESIRFTGLLGRVVIRRRKPTPCWLGRPKRRECTNWVSRVNISSVLTFSHFGIRPRPPLIVTVTTVAHKRSTPFCPKPGQLQVKSVPLTAKYTCTWLIVSADWCGFK